jgi:hypothetical protein
VSLILAWVLFPLVLTAVGLGWGVLVERVADARVGVLLVPLGLAAVLLVTLIATEWSATARVAVPLVGVGAVAGLILAWPPRRLEPWPLLAAVGILLVYGAPVLLSGQATFTGILKLDDTSTWLNIIDHTMTHLHPAAGSVSTSTYQLVFTGDVGPTYPFGAFMLPAVGHALTGIDAVWIVQPYIALCGAAIGLGVYALVEPVIESPRIRALIAFVAAQPALLYGYSLWGGEKEMTGGFLLVLGIALLARAIAERPANPRGLLPLAVSAAALIVTLSVGAIAWAGPALIGMVAVWVYRDRRAGLSPPALRRLARDLGLLGVGAAVLMLPVWLTLSSFLGKISTGLLTSSNRSSEEVLGNLLQPLSGWQLAGIWPVGDFRVRAPTLASVLLIVCVLAAAAVAIWLTVRRRQFSIFAYVTVALIGCAIFYLIGTTPWVLGKSLAISSPALLAAAATGAGLLWSHDRRWVAGVGMLAMAVIAGGVLWSNFLAYQDTTLAPHARFAELQHIGDLLKGKGPTFDNEYEVYADRHFLREGDPVEPAEYRPVLLSLSDGVLMTKSAEADLDSFGLSTLEPYRSIVTRRSPVESRPPSIYSLTWQGRYYQLWQRPARPSVHILQHVPLGESSTLPFCGAAQNGTSRPLCSIDPVAVPACPTILGLARTALREHAELVAYQRPAPIVVRGDDTLWPAAWAHDPEGHTLTPTTPGQAVSHIAVPGSQRYELWLGGNFARGFEVSVDGHQVGHVKDELSNFGGYVPVVDLFLTAGVHTFTLTYPHSDLTPGSGDTTFTTLTAIALEPADGSMTRLLTVAPRQAQSLCGRSLDWVEVVAPSA